MGTTLREPNMRILRQIRKQPVIMRLAPLSFDGKMVLLFLDSKGGRMESSITTKGQATIPKFIRKHLGLQPGDRVKFFMHPDGTVVLLPKTRATALRGIAKGHTARHVTIEQMTEAAAGGALRPQSLRRKR